jgi:hypothetical protein
LRGHAPSPWSDLALSEAASDDRRKREYNAYYNYVLQLPSILISYAVAEAAFILGRRQDITAAIKTSAQRTNAENERMTHGMVRSIVLDMFAFTPISTFVILETLKYTLPSTLLAWDGAYGMLGLLAYALPFMAVKRIVMAYTMRSLRAFHDVVSEAERAELEAGVAAESGDHNA